MIAPGALFLGKYRIVERLGEGGMGTVWRARDELLDRDVAIKELRADLAGDASLAERFRAEAVALARLAHPAIAALHGLERDGERFYMVMEYVPGATLDAIASREGPLPWQRAATLCAGVCDALGHAHQHGVVHRDIKPANVMLTPAEQVKVMDFGIARMTGQSRHTRHGSTIGTPHYMAPEQLRGEEVDGRADVYALGAVLFELISGHVPFDADSDYKLMMMQLHDPPPRASGEVDGVPGIVDRIIARAMAKDPAARYQTAGALREALQEAVRLAPSPGPFSPFDRGRNAGAATTVADETPLHRDWRSWAAAVMVIVAGALVFRGGGAAGDDPIVPDPDTASIMTVTPPPPPPPTGVTTARLGDGAMPTGEHDVRLPPAERVRGIPPPAAVPRQGTPPPQASAPTPQPPPPPATEPEERIVDHRPAIARAVTEWLGAMSRREPGGVAGQVDGRDLATLVREGRAGIGGIGDPAIAVDGERATASVSASLDVRSAFGSSRTHRVTFRVSLRENGGQWAVTAGRVQ